MSLKKCEKCWETVDEAKAFCPECGNSFEDEKARKADSEFELTGSTIKLSESAFDALLSDMGLDISDEAEEGDESAEMGAADLEPPRELENGTPKMPAAAKIILILFGIAVLIAVIYVVFIRNV